jgi:hypothetical protein
MTDVIDSIRGLRNQTLTYERGMSDLTVAIGNIERLTDLTPEQLERLWKAVSRLSKAALAKGKNDA